MSIRFLLATAMLSAGCKVPRPDRPSFVNKAPINAESNVTPEDAVKSPSEGPQIDPVTGKPLLKKDLSLNVVDSRSTMRIASVEVLINKLKILTALNEGSEAVKLARKTRQSLGAYDFAKGIHPENKWTSDKMGAWLKVVDEACRDTALLTRIQKTDGDKEFVESAFGRDIFADEATLLSNLKLAGPRRARVICTAILSSGEFVSL